MPPFPKLPDLIQPLPSGPTFDPNTYSNLVTQTLQPGVEDLDAIERGIEALRALTVAAELDVPGWVSDFDAADTAITDLGEIQWGSPEPDLQPVTDYLTARRDEVQGTADRITAPPPLSLLQPNGGAVVTLGGAPSQGGVVKAGSPPYTYHLQLFTVRAGIDNVDANGGTGPNPPFASFGPVVKETGLDGKLYWVYLVQINPQTPGTYTAQVQYLTHGTFLGITGTFPGGQVFQVVIQ